MSGRAIDTAHGPYEIKLNPRFDKRLDGLVNELATIALQIKAPLEEAQDLLAELQDYIGFETEKTQLRRDRGVMQGDMSEIEGASLWLRNLQVLAEAFPATGVMHSLDAINDVTDAISLGLQGKEVDHPEE